MIKKIIVLLLTAALIFGVVPTAAAGGTNVGTPAKTEPVKTGPAKTVTGTGKVLTKKPPEGFPSYIPLVEDAVLEEYHKGSGDPGFLYIIFKTSQSAQKLWDFYSNVDLYLSEFSRCIGSYDNKAGKIKFELSSYRQNRMQINIGQDTDKQMYIAFSISAPQKYASLLGTKDDRDFSVEDEQSETFIKKVLSLEQPGISGLNISGDRTKANRDAFKGKIAAGFPVHIPLAKNTDNVVVDHTFQLDDLKYTEYNYRLKIPEPECLEFYRNYRNYPNLESFEFDYENYSGLINLKVYARSKTGIMAGVTYYYNGTRGTVRIAHNSKEDRMLIMLE